jgi:Protein of unknown function (DUF3800)
VPDPRYRLYLDESGDHAGSEADDVGKRYLALAGLRFTTGSRIAFGDRLEELKRRHFSHDPDEPLILHRRDLMNGRGKFGVLLNPEKRAAFDADVLRLITNTDFQAICIVIDKHEHQAKTYRRLRHPYVYCLQAMLERYCGYMARFGGKGDVLAEARGGAEDMTLKAEYERIYQHGGGYLTAVVAQKTLTSKQLKLKPKKSNLPGLQLADLLAHPMKMDVLVHEGRIADRGGPFAEEIAKALEPKYNRQAWENRIRGYGRILLT